MRKFALILALLLAGATALHAQVGTPYKYGHRWSIAAFGGSMVFNGDYSTQFVDHHMVEEFFSALGGLALWYNLTDGYELRFSANYSKKAGVVSPDYGFLPYTFRSINGYADFVVNYRGLGEYYTAFIPRLYVGTGLSYTYGFNRSWIDGEDMPVLSEKNYAPSFHLGFQVEYAFPSGFGLIFDMGVASFLDPYNGLAYNDFPIDFEFDTWFGVVYHFKLPKKYKKH